ncbi:MAG: hypothetical protein ACREIF_16245 [Chthoniobacterales bacterium]
MYLPIKISALLFCIALNAAAAEAPDWITVEGNPKVSIATIDNVAVVVSGQVEEVVRKRTESFTVEIETKRFRESELRARHKMPEYIFGWGKLSKKYDRPVTMLSALKLRTGGRILSVPDRALKDIANPYVPRHLTVAKRDDLYVITVGGPDGSESYDCQFIASTTKFLYRLVRVSGVPGNPEEAKTFFLSLE